MLGQPDENRSGYDLTKMQDFLDRGQLMVNAAQRLDKDANIDDAWKKFETEIKSHCNLDIDKMRQVEGRQAYFDAIYEKSEKIFAFLLLDLGLALNGGQNDKKAINTAIKEIKKEEIKLISDNGRPVIFKVDHHSDNENKFFSMQMPLGNKTLPSSDRSGNNNETKLSNHVRDATGSVNINQPSEIQILQSVDGHSSFSTISEKNNDKRTVNTNKAVREKLLSFALEALSQRNPSDKSEITVSWSTMMLLSPLLNAAFERVARGTESEHSQLSESAAALEKIDDEEFLIDNLIRSVYGTIPDEFAAFKGVWVKVDIDYMDTAVNVMAKASEITPLYNRINQNGFVKFSNNVVTFIENHPDKNSLPQEARNIIDKIIASKGGMSENDAKDAIATLNGMLNTLDGAKHKDLILLSKRFIETHQEFINQSDGKNPYLLVTRYVQCNRAIGRFVDLFCKSAEDRTGWARVRLAADEMYFAQHNRDPDFNTSSDAAEYDRLVLKAVEMSASIENTKYNSESRGFQVGGKHVHNDVAKINKKMGNIAKKPYNNVKANIEEWQNKQSLQNRRSTSQTDLAEAATPKPNSLKRQFSTAALSDRIKRFKRSDSGNNDTNTGENNRQLQDNQSPSPSNLAQNTPAKPNKLKRQFTAAAGAITEGMKRLKPSLPKDDNTKQLKDMISLRIAEIANITKTNPTALPGDKQQVISEAKIAISTSGNANVIELGRFHNSLLGIRNQLKEDKQIENEAPPATLAEIERNTDVEVEVDRLMAEIETDADAEVKADKLMAEIETDADAEVEADKLMAEIETDADAEVEADKLMAEIETDADAEVEADKLMAEIETDADAEVEAEKSIETQLAMDSKIEASELSEIILPKANAKNNATLETALDSHVKNEASTTDESKNVEDIANSAERSEADAYVPSPEPAYQSTASATEEESIFSDDQSSESDLNSPRSPRFEDDASVQVRKSVDPRASAKGGDIDISQIVKLQSAKRSWLQSKELSSVTFIVKSDELNTIQAQMWLSMSATTNPISSSRSKLYHFKNGAELEINNGTTVARGFTPEMLKSFKAVVLPTHDLAKIQVNIASKSQHNLAEVALYEKNIISKQKYIGRLNSLSQFTSYLWNQFKSFITGSNKSTASTTFSTASKAPVLDNEIKHDLETSSNKQSLSRSVDDKNDTEISAMRSQAKQKASDLKTALSVNQTTQPPRINNTQTPITKTATQTNSTANKMPEHLSKARSVPLSKEFIARLMVNLTIVANSDPAKISKQVAQYLKNTFGKKEGVQTKPPRSKGALLTATVVRTIETGVKVPLQVEVARNGQITISSAADNPGQRQIMLDMMKSAIYPNKPKDVNVTVSSYAGRKEAEKGELITQLRELGYKIGPPVPLQNRGNKFSM